MADESDIFDSSSSEDPSEYLRNLDDSQRNSLINTLFTKARNIGSDAARVAFCGTGVALVFSSAQAISSFTGIDPAITGSIASMISELFTGETVRRIVGSDDVSNDPEVLEITSQFQRKLLELQEEYRFDLNHVLEQIDDVYNMGGEILSTLNTQTELMRGIHTGVKDIQRWTRKQGQVQSSSKDTSINLLPGRYNPDSFVGRQEILQDIDKGLSDSGAFLLLGEPGIGKTSIVRQFVELSTDLYQHVLWIDATNEKTIQRDLRQIGVEINISDPDYPDNETSVMHWLNNTDDTYILVFDGAGNYDSIERLIPKNRGNGHILVTSNDRSLRYDFSENTEVHAFSLDEAEDFLYSRLGDQGQFISNLASTLGYHPEALDRAARFIDLAKLSIEDYLDIFGEKSQKLFHTVPAALGLNQITTTVDRITLDELAGIMPESREIGYLLSFMASNKIPRGILYGFDELPLEGLSETLADESVAIEALALLHRYGLIGLDEDYISMSPGTQAAIHTGMRARLQSVWQENAFRLMYAHFAFNQNDYESWENFGEVAPHIASILNKLTIETNQDVQGITVLIRKLSKALSELSQYELSLQLARNALDLDIERFGADSLSVAWDYELIGKNLEFDAYRNKVELESALDYFQKAHEILIRHYKSDDPILLRSVAGIGTVLHRLERYEESLEFLEEMMQIVTNLVRQNPVSNSHAWIASTLRKFASYYYYRGEFNKSLNANQLALLIFSKAYNESMYPNGHMRIVETLCGIADIHYSIQNYDLAMENALKSNEMASSILPTQTHMFIALNHFTVGRSLYKLGRYSDALDHLYKVVGTFEKLYRDEYHGRLVDALFWAGLALEKLGEDEKSKWHIKKAYKILNESEVEVDKDLMSKVQKKVMKIEDETW